MRTVAEQRGATSAPAGRFESVSAVGLAAMVAALHLAVLAGRLGGPARCARGRDPALLIWRRPEQAPVETFRTSQRVPSNPQRAYHAGRLALASGVAVLALARALPVMRLGAARGR
ncbi:MAG: hypothetical protein HRF43_10705 [Phycisphaerae bacterium]|jgi:hypothetical protein